MLEDPERTAFVIVTTAEELPVDETAELLAGVRGRGLPEPLLLVVNSLYPVVHRSDVDADPGAARFLEARRAIGERHLARLASAWHGPRLDVPLIPARRAPELLAALVRHVEEAVG
jgi:anion-transporting  ArsA/GET3 family ATPase